jgi:2',3'-cyclic-nucleotide 2'-phosphodiesterase (5'-nucleotidase family)
MKVDVNRPAGDRVRDVRVTGQPLDPARGYTVAIPDFIFNGGDGYTMFAGQRVLIDPASGATVLSALETYVAAKKEIAPQIDGRIAIVR